MRKSRLRRQSPIYLSPSPSPRELSPQPSSVLGDGDGDSTTMSTSRPTSLALYTQPILSSTVSPPSLRDILSNKAPPPWTLSAFMAYLSQNHCLETLEFTMDAERYKTAYAEILQGQTSWMRDGNEHICSLWQKLMHAYITPYGPREVNLPAHVRDYLLSLPAAPTPPNPSELDEAVRIVYELMNDSLLVPFLESVTAAHQEAQSEEAHESRQGRTRVRISKDLSSSTQESSRSPKTRFLPLLTGSRSSDQANRSASSSSEPADRDVGLSEDTGSAGSPNSEPMTPPNTPPTSDWGFTSSGSSPSGLQRAISAHSSGWRKMGAKLGLSRKGRKNRSNPSNVTSGVPGPDAPTSDASQSGGASGSGSGSSSNNPL